MLYRAQDLLFAELPAEQGKWTAVESVPALPQAGAHVWLCPLQNDNALMELDTQEEKKRAENMLPESKASEFLLSRGWLRVILASYIAGSSPGEIPLERSAEGKPFLTDHPNLHFNVSHSHGLAAIGIARQSLGIDIEKLRPMPDWQSLAEGLLTNHAITEILRLPVVEQAAGFLRSFTAREAQLKAFGFGLSGILQAMDFHSIVVNHSTLSNSTLPPVMAIHNYNTPSPLPEIDGYVGHICLAPEIAGSKTP